MRKMVKGKRVLQHLCLYPGVLGLAGKNTSRGSRSDSVVDAYEVNFYTVMLLQCIRCVFDGVCAEEKCFLTWSWHFHDGHLIHAVSPSGNLFSVESTV